MSWAIKGHYNGPDDVTNYDFNKSHNPKPAYWILLPVLAPEEELILSTVKGPDLVVWSRVFCLQTPWSEAEKGGKLKYSPCSVGFVSSVLFSVHFRISVIAFSAEKLQRFVTRACDLLVYHRGWKFSSWTFLLFPRRMNWNLQMVPGSQFHISWSRTCITNQKSFFMYLLDTAICQSLQLYRGRVWWDEVCNSVDETMLLCSFLVQFKVLNSLSKSVYKKNNLQTQSISLLYRNHCKPQAGRGV